jgi:hypothetical protein
MAPPFSVLAWAWYMRKIARLRQFLEYHQDAVLLKAAFRA